MLLNDVQYWSHSQQEGAEPCSDQLLPVVTASAAAAVGVAGSLLQAVAKAYPSFGALIAGFQRAAAV